MRTTPFRRHAAFRGLLIAAVCAAAPAGCRPLTDAERECLARLEAALQQTPVYERDEFTLVATWVGNAEHCIRTGVRWELSPNLLALAYRDMNVDVRALTRGPAWARVEIGEGVQRFENRLDFGILRTTGDLDVRISGLDDDVDADVNIAGPGGFTQGLTRSKVIEDLEAGVYSITARPFQQAEGQRWGAATGTGTVEVRRNAVSTHGIGYALDNAELRIRHDVPEGTQGPFGGLTGSDFLMSLEQREQRIGVEPGVYTIELNTVAPNGLAWKPKIPLESLTAVRGQRIERVFEYEAQRGGVRFMTDGLPEGLRPQGTVTGNGGTWTAMLPGKRYFDPGTYQLDAPGVIHADAQRSVYSYFEPVESRQSFQIDAGLVTTLNIPYRLDAERSDFHTSITPWSGIVQHAPFIGLGTAMRLEFQWRADRSLTVRGVSPFFPLTGTVAEDGSFSAAGSGTLAGFPAVPGTMTGTILNGSLEAYLQYGQDTHPTGLPGGSITYRVLGIRVTF